MLTFKHLFAFLVSRIYGTMATASISNSMLRFARRRTGISVIDQSGFGTGHFFFFQFKLNGKLFCAGPQVRQDLIRLTGHLPVKVLYCAFVRGTTESLPWRTRGESENNLSSLIFAKDIGFASAFPALIVTTGFLESEASTETTLAVPTAHLQSPVS